MILLLTGGSGFIGQQVVPMLLKDPQIERIRILSRSEHVQAELKEKWKSEKVDFFIGDVRDFQRVKRAMESCHGVYHFAATKRVESCEYDPQEAIKTNVTGTQNVIDACLQTPTVEKAIFTSTDKAVEPINIYGLTKALAEKIWIQANIGKHRVKFGAARYGNVLGSYGSVVEKWKEQKKLGKLITVVDSGMTRFFISPKDAAQFVISSFHMIHGGEVFLPKMKSIEMTTMADVFGGNKEFISPRPGEKMHEKLIAEAERTLVDETPDRYIRWPEYNLFPVLTFGRRFTGTLSSETAERFTREELCQLLSS